MMYNLLMVYAVGTWDGSPYECKQERVFEYTSDALKEQFQSLEGEALAELITFPTLFAYETQTGGAARLGWIRRVLTRGNTVRIDYSLDETLPEVTAASIENLVWELDIGEWELNRTHWAVKNVDLFAVLIEAGLITEAQFRALPPNRQIGFDAERNIDPIPILPSVFRIPHQVQEQDLVSVMMPFRNEFQSAYNTLQNACGSIGLRCQNANEVWNENEIIQEIFSLIYRSKIVICDFSDQNANVFYEAGIAHTLGRPVIPIVQNPEHIPFDLQHHRYIQYLNNAEGLQSLHSMILPRLETLKQQ